MEIHSKLVLESPYKGLMPYAEEDALFFFGREDWEEIIAANLQNSPLTVLYGASGVGKSSVLRAGVARRLRQETTRDCMKYGTPKFAVVVFPSLDGKRSWSSPDPLASLVEQIEIDLQSVLKGQEFELSSSAPQLDQVLKAWTERIGGKYGRGRLLIVLDQFEEYFLYHSQEKDEQKLISALASTVGNSDLPVNFLISIREDWIGQLSRLKQYIPTLMGNSLYIEHLEEDEARETITKPIDEYNRQQVIINNLMDSRLTVLYGEENVGKSSVLESGVAHRLRRLAKDNWEDSDKPNWAVVFFRNWQGQGDPVANLLKQVGTEIENIYQEKGKKIEPVPQSYDLEEGLKAWLEGIDAGGKLLIILDQFEQYFQLKSEVREKFAVELASVVARSDLPVNFLLSIHKDCLEKLNLLTEFGNIQYISELLNPDKYLFFKPLEELSLGSQEKIIDITDELVDKILEEVRTSYVKKLSSVTGIGGTSLGAGRGIETPYLQLAMTHLWREGMSQRKDVGETGSLSLGIDTWEKLGGIENIAKKHLEELMESESVGERSLTEDEKKAAADVFRYLVTSTGTKIAYPVRDLLHDKELKIEPTILDSMLEKLRGNERVLRGPFWDKEGHECYEIFHDALALAILEWRKQYYFKEERKKRLITLKGLPAQALSQLKPGQHEVAALLARQAYLFNKRDNLEILDQVDESLRTVLSQPFSCILPGHEGEASAVAFSSDGTLLASGSHDGHVRLWNLNEPGTPPKVFWGNQHNGIECMAFSRDGRYLAAGSWDNCEGDKTFLRLWDLHQENPVPTVLRGHEAMVGGVAFSPEADILASASHDGTVRLWNLRQPGEVERVDPPLFHPPEYWFDPPVSWVWSVAFSPDGKVLASACRDTTVRLWDPYPPGTLLGEIHTDHENEIISVAFSPTKARLLATASRDQTVRLWDLSQLDAPRLLMILADHIECVRSVAFSSDGNLLASGSEDQTVQLYDVRNPEAPVPLDNLSGHYAAVSSVAFSPNPTPILASSSWDQTVRLWDLSEPVAQPKVLRDHEAQVMSVAFSPDGKSLASGGWEKDNNVKLWDLEHLDKPPKNLPHGHTDKVFAVAFFYSEDRQIQKLASGSQDKTLRVWDLQQLGAKPFVFYHPYGVSSVAFSPGGEILASGCWDNNVRLWTFGKAEPVAVFGNWEHTESITAVAFSPDGKLLASASDDKTIGLWNVEQPDSNSSKKIAKWQAHEKRVWSVAFSPDGKMLASASDDRTVKLWDISQPDHPTLIKELSGHYYWVSSVAFSPDGKRLVSGSYDKTIRLWNLEHLDKNPIIFQGHRMSVTSIAISPDGKTLASGSYDDTIRLWNLNTDYLAEVVCQKVCRDLTPEEWRQFIGNDIPYEHTCFASTSKK